VALFVLGGFLILTANLERLSGEWAKAAELSVFLKDQIAPEERRAIEQAVAPGQLVASYELVSKATARAVQADVQLDGDRRRRPRR